METESPHIEAITRGKWQWKSNQDLWSTSEESQWESFLPKHNYLLEKAFYDQQKEVDLGDYIVSLEDMKQTKKTNAASQRPVRRINWMESVEEVDRSERYFETELPKTINKIFGGLDDFIRFFSKRNPEILSFTQKFEDFENSNDVNGLNGEILPRIVECLSHNLKVEESTQDIIRLFKKEFTSFKEFYGQILKAYTMSSCLYRNLNHYLRNESWVEIDSLLPYACCFCKTFLYFENNDDDLNLKDNVSSITLYRGTALDETALSFYDLKKLTNFSWNSATSASKREKVAQNFMFRSADIPNKKYPVMFIIEVPIEGESEYLKWIEASPYSAFPKEDEVILAPGSAFELQNIQVDQNKITKILIKMKNETKSLAHKGFMMQGALQSEMLTDSTMKIMCLEGEELSEALGHIFGNKFINNIEFYLCKFNQSSLKKMMQVIPTTEKVNGLTFFSCSNQDEEKVSSPKSKGVENFNIKKLEIFETENFNTIFATDSAHSKYWVSLRELNINFQAITDEKVNHLSWQGLGLLSQLTHLSLNFNRSYMLTNKGVHNLCSNGLKYLTQLISLQLDFAHSDIGNEGVNDLCCQGLQHLTRLTSLSLKIDVSQSTRKFTDQEIINLCLNGLRYLVELTSLEIEFPSCAEITDQGMSNFSSQGLQHLPHLVSLRIAFLSFQKITDEGIKHFFHSGVKYLKNLESLDLDFSYCIHLTGEVLESLSCQGLKYLTHLKFLNLRFDYCPQMTDQGLNHLFNSGLVHLTRLEALKLYFTPIGKTITYEGLNNLLSQSLTLAEYRFFSLNDQSFFHTLNQSNLQNPQKKLETQPQSKFICSRTLEAQSGSSEADKVSRLLYWNIQKKRLQNLSRISKQSWSTSNMSRKGKAKFKKLKKMLSCNKSYLQDLKPLYQSPSQPASLTIHLSRIESKTKEELQNLCSQKLKYLTRLKSLTLDFSQCCQKTNDALHVLCSQRFQSVITLTSCHLDFSQDKGQTDERINILCSLHVQSLVHLKSLHLNFSKSCTITNEGIKNLCILGLKHLIELESLSIDFRLGTSCPSIRDEGVNNLCFYGLKYLTQLTSLNLDFTDCGQIKVEGLNTLLDYGIENLTQLKSLNLDFSIKPGTVCFIPNSINCLGFQKLDQLTSLSLSFAHRWLMNESGMENLCSRGLQNLTQLVSLNINFSECNTIRDREVEILCSKGLKYLTQLRYLELNFSTCRVITDQGVNHLCFEIPKYLTKLEAFELNFQDCILITPFTKQNILRILRFFGFTVSSS